jgi:uncharacterized protein (DUF1697 family)
MPTYIAILRGINVAGKAKIKMSELKLLFEDVRCEKVKTYIQSGNVIFDHSEASTHVLETTLSERIVTTFGHQVPVIILTPEKLQRVVSNNPFRTNPAIDDAYLYVTFLSRKPAPFDADVLLSNKKEWEEIAWTDEAVYFYSPNGYGTTKLDNNFLEKKLKVAATTRNWRTTLELLRLANE